MTISIGDKLPDATFKTMTADGAKDMTTNEIFAGKRVVLFGVPGAFTPGCDRVHLPGFVEQADELFAKGVNQVACIAVNDAFVMDAWGKAHNVGEKIVMLADGNGDFTKAMGLELDGSAFGLGSRSKRYAAIIDDGKVTRIDVDEAGGVVESSCGAVLGRL